MSDAIIITFIICTTIVILAYIGNDNKNDKE